MKANCKDAVEEIQAIIDVVESRGIAYVRKVEGAVDKLNNVLACLRCFEIGTQIPGEIALVKHGKWLKVYRGMFYECVCSCCTHDLPKDSWGQEYYSDYCPNCGAKMDLKE